MRGRAAGRAASLAAAAVMLATLTAGCGAREIGVPAAEAVPAPTFATLPDDLADSPHLAALTLRDTAGLPPSVASADAAALPVALDAVLALDPRPETFTRISVYDDMVFISWADPTTPSRSFTGVYYPSDTESPLSVSGPSFDDEPTFTLDGVDPAVPQRLVDAIEDRFPDVVVEDVDLRVSLSYGFGRVWNLSVSDARGSLATVYADLDGMIVGVD